VRPRFGPRPSRTELLSRPLHVTVRDYPETLPALRRAGVSLTDGGATSLEAMVGGDSPLVDELVEAVAWRPSA
jgi:hypothetical protein